MDILFGSESKSSRQNPTIFSIVSELQFWFPFLAIVFQYVEQPIPERNESLPQFWWGAQQM